MSRTVAAALILLLAATWPLWTAQTTFPRVPLIGLLRDTPAWLESCALAVVLVALLNALLAGSGRRTGRGALFVSAAALAGIALCDQHRLQPWAYQLSLLALILAILPAHESLGWSRLLVASVYFYSALSKLDWTFLESGGGQVVDGLLAFLHTSRERSSHWQPVVAGTLALGELFVAGALFSRRWRFGGLVGSIAMHVLLLAAVGPWGAGHKPGVLLWNVYFIMQNVLLFGSAARTRPPADNSSGRPIDSGSSSMAALVWRSIVRGLIVFVLLFPLSEPFGVCDVWPAWAVYAAGPERARVYIDDADTLRLPATIRAWVDSPRFANGRRLVRIDRWSLDATDAPLYPQNRFRLGVALALSQAAGLEESIHVELDGPADRWTGRRSSRTLTGSAELMAELDHYWLNGFPCPFAARAHDANR